MQKSKVNIQKYLFFLILGFGILCFASSVEAATFTATGNPGDTEQGTVITAEATNQTLNYTDINGNPKPEVNPADDIEVTVLPVYGFSTADLPDMGVRVSQMVTNEMFVTNEGNASDQYDLSFYCDFSAAGTGTWTVDIRRSSDDSLVASLTSGSPHGSTTESVAEDADYGFYHEITAPSDGTYDAYVVVYSTSETSSTPTGEYTGANGLTYAGLGIFTSQTSYEVYKPLFTMTRISTVDAPKASVGYGGGIHDAVPGAIITYQITYRNLGDGTAESVVLVDKIPDNTHLAHINYDLNDDTDNVDITKVQCSMLDVAGDGKWTVWYSTLDSPNKAYGNTSDWTLMGTLETTDTKFPGGSATYSLAAPASPETNAKWVKWENSSIQTTPTINGDPQMTWGVTIR